MKTVTSTHVGAYGIIIQDNKIALIKKARGGYKGKLDLPGGGIEHTELPHESLKRELIEEIGVAPKDFKLFDVTATNITWLLEKDLYEDLHHIGLLYLVNLEDKDLKSDGDGIDSEGAAWYAVDDLKKDELSPFVKYSLEKLGYKLK